MKRSLWKIIGTCVALTVVWFGYHAWKAGRNVVTLHVNNMPVRAVISKLKWQTWEDIRVQQDVNGFVTLNVENSPLDVVLGLISQQLEVRWTVAYPIYRGPKALAMLDRIATGDTNVPLTGWSSWNARFDFGAMRAAGAGSNAKSGRAEGSPNPGGGFMGSGGPGGGFMGGLDASTGPVTLSIENQSLTEAAASLRRASRARVIAQDDSIGHLTASFNQTPLDKAVAIVAKKSNKSWTKFYVLETRRRPQPPLNGERRSFASGPRPSREEMQARMEVLREDPAFQDRMLQNQRNRLKTTTPEQRATRGARGGFGGRSET
ncbi:MAG: hypothetical protein EXS36_07800 [Pedosphaera sp.]|nr:hypothetical protein [Pedosphaera sp.]